MKSPRTTKTLHLRFKDKHAKVLRSLAYEVNMVWNYINELSFTHTQRTGKFFSSYDLQNYTKGATKEGLKLNSASVQMIGAEYVTRRQQFKKVKLNWRVSNPNSSKRSLGWIPFRHDCISYEGGQIQYAGIRLGLWDSYGLSSYELGSGSISEDSRGRWYLNITVTSPGWPKSQNLDNIRCDAIGIDLGLKDLIACSDGLTV
jgi:putative transposase